MTTLQISDLKCDVFPGRDLSATTYLIYPMVVDLSATFLEGMVEKYGYSVAVVYVPADEWNNYLTPWAEPPEAQGFDPFEGKGEIFLKMLQTQVIPKVEKTLHLPTAGKRNLIGVSLSGLFALWQWMLCDTFESIASLSGSFWYSGFREWFDSREIPAGKVKAFFLLGREEPHAKIKAYQSVGVNTEEIVARLKSAGIDVGFEWVPGNHFSDPQGRLELAFENI